MARAQGRCVFCDGASGVSLSREHVFPDWLRQLFPRSPTDTHTHGVVNWASMDVPDVLSRRMAATRQRQGQASTRKVRVVCKKCNNEWLSALEARTKPLLMELITGAQRNIGAAEQSALAVWAAKTIMTAEFIERTKIAIPLAHRQFLMTNLTVPDGWWIWVAGSQGIQWRTGLYHFSAKLNVSLIDLETPDALNIQCTTIGIGALLIHAISTTVPGHSFVLDNPNKSDLRSIWPVGAPIAWPPARLLSDDDIDVIKTNLERAYQLVRTDR